MLFDIQFDFQVRCILKEGNVCNSVDGLPQVNIKNWANSFNSFSNKTSTPIILKHIFI